MNLFKYLNDTTTTAAVATMMTVNTCLLLFLLRTNFNSFVGQQATPPPVVYNDAEMGGDTITTAETILVLTNTSADGFTK